MRVSANGGTPEVRSFNAAGGEQLSGSRNSCQAGDAVLFGVLMGPGWGAVRVNDGGHRRAFTFHRSTQRDRSGRQTRPGISRVVTSSTASRSEHADGYSI